MTDRAETSVGSSSTEASAPAHAERRDPVPAAARAGEGSVLPFQGRERRARRARHGRGRRSPAAKGSVPDASPDEDARALDEVLSQRVRLLVPLSPLIVFFSGLDWMAYPELAPRWLAYRVATVALLVLVVQPLVRRLFRGAPFPELLSFALVTSLCFSRMAFESGGFRSKHYVVFVLLCWAFSVVAPLGVRRSVLLAQVFLVPYAIAGALGGSLGSVSMAFHLLVLFGALIFTVLGGHLSATLFLAQRRAERKAEHLIRLLEESARRDPLTGTWNRRALTERVESALGRLRRVKACFCLIIADLDHFKSVNDRFGHPVGDRVLVRFCREVEAVLRGHDDLFRLGGEEFAVLLNDANLSDASVAAERVRSTVEAMRIDAAGGPLHVTASLGIAEARAEDEIGSLLERADEALYRAKAGGRNRVVGEARDAEDRSSTEIRARACSS